MEYPIAIIGIIGWLLFWEVSASERRVIRLLDRLMAVLESDDDESEVE